MIITIYCDAGSKKLALIDAHLNRYMIAEQSRKSSILGESRAIMFAINYATQTYYHQNIIILSDSKTTIDVLNGKSSYHVNSENGNAKKLEGYAKLIRLTLKEAIQKNNIELKWIRRERNDAGLFLNIARQTKITELRKKYSVEEFQFDSMQLTYGVKQDHNVDIISSKTSP